MSWLRLIDDGGWTSYLSIITMFTQTEQFTPLPKLVAQTPRGTRPFVSCCGIDLSPASDFNDVS